MAPFVAVRGKECIAKTVYFSVRKPKLLLTATDPAAIVGRKNTGNGKIEITNHAVITTQTGTF